MLDSMYESKIFESMFDIIPFGVYVASTQTYEVIYMNSYFREVLGGQPEGKCYEAIYGEDTPCFHCNFKQLLTADGKPNGKTLVYEHFNESNDRWYQMQDKCISWPTGEIVKYSIAVDITDRKRYQNELAEAHATLALNNKKLLNQNRLQQELLIQQIGCHRAGNERAANIDGDNGPRPLHDDRHNIVHAEKDNLSSRFNRLAGQVGDRNIEIAAEEGAAE